MKSGFASRTRSGLGEELGAWVSTSLVELFKTAIIRKGSARFWKNASRNLSARLVFAQNPTVLTRTAQKTAEEIELRGATEIRWFPRSDGPTLQNYKRLAGVVVIVDIVSR
jgi:hypothetical protein